MFKQGLDTRLRKSLFDLNLRTATVERDIIESYYYSLHIDRNVLIGVFLKRETLRAMTRIRANHSDISGTARSLGRSCFCKRITAYDVLSDRQSPTELFKGYSYCPASVPASVLEKRQIHGATMVYITSLGV